MTCGAGHDVLHLLLLKFLFGLRRTHQGRGDWNAPILIEHRPGRLVQAMEWTTTVGVQLHGLQQQQPAS
jgi:hypothetical protein